MLSFLKFFVSFNFINLNFILTISDKNSTKLLMSQLIFRHGNRAPAKIYESSPCPLFLYKDGYASLLNEGKWNSYIFGTDIRKRYIQDTETRILESNSSYNEICSVSTPVERCTQTLQAILSGLFPPIDTYYMWNKNLNWNPFPFKTSEKGKDHILMSEGSNCPRLKEIKDKKLNSVEMKNFFFKNRRLIDYLSIKSGIRVNNKTIRWLYQTLLIEKLDMVSKQPVCKITANWATEELMMEFKNLIKEYLNIMYDINDIEYAKLLGGPLLKTLISKMSNYDEHSVPKLYLYSAHDSTLYNLMSALKINIEETLDFLSTFTFELYEDVSSKKKYVELYFYDLKSSSSGFRKIKIPGCSYPCLLLDFSKSYNQVVSVNRTQECLPSYKIKTY